MTARAPAAVSALLALAACAGPARLPAPRPLAFTSPEDVIGRLPTPDSLWPAYRIRAQLAFSTPDGRGSFSSDIRVRRGDSILVRLRAPLGIEAARALITRDSVFFHDRIAGVLYTGDVDSGILPAGFGGGDLAAAFFGFDRPTGAFEIASDSGLLRLERRDGRETVVVDPAVWRVTLRDLRRSDGTVVESRRFTGFESMAGLVVPRRIVTMRPAEHARASFVVRSVDADAEGRSYRLDLPDKIPRIPVR